MLQGHQGRIFPDLTAVKAPRGADGTLPAVGSIVDLSKATYTKTTGGHVLVGLPLLNDVPATVSGARLAFLL